MKLQIVSDLHLEFFKDPKDPTFTGIEPAPDADVLVLAGDIGVRAAGIERFKGWPVPVIYVAGNHEFYSGYDLGKTNTQLGEVCADLGFHFLEQDALVLPEHPGVRFLGTCMWTDYLLFGRPKQAVAMYQCGEDLTDHSRIRSGGDRFTPRDAMFRHVASKSWIRGQFAVPFDGKTVVITHHGCHWCSVGPRWQDDLVSAGFSSDLTELLQHADLWIHGHTHESFDYEVEGCRVIVNPRGYPLRGRGYKNEEGGYENPDFKPQVVIAL